ncbi:MAG: hypothetical protein ABIT36_02105 [Steroidobacteraceae bacterium]
MNTTHYNPPILVRNGSGQLISDRRARPRRPPRRRNVEPGKVVMSTITLALLGEKLLRSDGGSNPYDNGQARDLSDLWGNKRRD